jgi:hypothetical protein
MNVVGTQSHSPWLFPAISLAYVLLGTAGRLVVRRVVGGSSWLLWREHARALSPAQRWAIYKAVSRRKRVGDERLVPATLARIQLARTLLAFTRRRAFLVYRWVAGLLVLAFIPVSLLAHHAPSEPAWILWYVVVVSLILGIGLIVAYPWLITWMGRRLDQAERANRDGGTAEREQ